MKRKFWMALFATLLSVCFAFGLAACDENGGTSGVELTKDTDFEALVSDKVTENEWRAAFTDEKFWNVTVVYPWVGEILEAFARQCTETRCLHCITESVIVDFEGDIIKIYENYGDGWDYRTEEISQEELEEINALYFGIELVACDFSEYYSEFTYDEARGAYVYEGDGITVPRTLFGGAATLKYIELKFVGGYLAFSHWKDGSDGETHDYTYYYYDYGTTVVEIPELTQSLPTD